MTSNGTVAASIGASVATDAAGNPNTASTSTDSTVTFTASPANITSTAGTPQSATINAAFATALQATVTNGSGNPVSGVSVTFTAPASGASGKFANNTTTTTAITNANGIATASTFTANATAGVYNVSASINAGSPSTTFSLTNNKINQAITVNTHAPSTATYNSSFTVAATTSGSGLSVTYSSSGSCTNTGALFTMTSGAGTCTVKYDQAGDVNSHPATQVTEQVTAQKAVTTTNLSSSANPSEAGQSVTFTATVSSAAGTPTGTVQFKVDGSSTGIAPVGLNGSGVAAFSTSALTAGPHAVTADYSGDTNFATRTGTLSGGQQVNTLPSISANDVSITEGNSGTTNLVFTITLSQASNLTVTVDYATADGSATTADSDYQAATGTLTFSPGTLTQTISVTVNGDTRDEPNEVFVVNLSGAVNASLVDNQGLGTILSDDTPLIEFSSSTYSVNEDELRVFVTVNRRGDLSKVARVDYTTSDSSALNNCNQVTGNASSRCDYATTVGTILFAAGESSEAISIPIVNDVYIEGGSEVLTFTLSNVSNADLGTITTATVIILDADNGLEPNPIDNNSFFIRQHYLDFLGREPEPAGLTGWQNVLNNCGTTVQPPCDRVEVSAGFFRSPEFQDRGYFIYRFYSAVGRIPLYEGFMPDFAKVSGFFSAQQLEENKVAFVNEFMMRSDFQTKYGSLPDPTAYVDALLQTIGLPNHPIRQTWINGLTNGSMSRGQVLRSLVESTEVYQKYYNEAFVIMQYFGYLRRSADISYLQWIQTMNSNGGDYRVMINGFLNSLEYRQRFGP
jgi:hypothetical protein